MNSKELRALREKLGDDVLNGFLADAGCCVKAADGMYSHYRAERQTRKHIGRDVPPALMVAFIHLLVAQSFIDEEVAGGLPMAAALEVLNAMLPATSDTWLRVGWEGETP